MKKEESEEEDDLTPPSEEEKPKKGKKASRLESTLRVLTTSIDTSCQKSKEGAERG